MSMSTSQRPQTTISSDDSKKRVIVAVPLSDIDFDNVELCFRVDFNLSNLKEDINANGQQFPVVLRTIEFSDKYQIISGFRRCNALRELGRICVDAEIRNITDDEAYYLSYIENDKRKNLSGLDKALAISKLLAKGKSPKEIQTLYGIGERQYYRLKKVTDFPPALKDAISDGFIQITHGLLLMEMHSDRCRAVDFDEWIDWIIENSASVRQLKRALKKRCRSSVQHRMTRTDKGGFRFSGFIFDPQKADKVASETILGEMKEAVTIIEKWISNYKNVKD